MVYLLHFSQWPRLSLPQEEIVVALLRQLGWTYFIVLLPLKNHLQRDFYVQFCRVEGWGVSTLRQKIDSAMDTLGLSGSLIGKISTPVVRNEASYLKRICLSLNARRPTLRC